MSVEKAAEVVTNSAVVSNLKEALATLINSTITGLSSAGDFLKAEIPEVIRQLLVWEFTQSFLFFLFGLVLLFGVPFFFYKSWKKPDPIINETGSYQYVKFQPNFWYDKDGGLSPTILLPIIGCIASTLLGIYLLNVTWLKIWLAPKVYLIQYVADMFK